MVSGKFIVLSALALIMSVLTAWYMEIRGDPFDFMGVIISSILGIAFMSIVIVRLPVFKGFYGVNRPLEESRDFASVQAAPIMSAIVTSLFMAALVYLFDFDNKSTLVLSAAVSAGVVSFSFE